MNCESAILLAFGASLFSTGAHAKPLSIYPDVIQGQVWTDIQDFNEPQLWPPGALGKFAERYRLSISGIVCRSYVIRIDVTRKGGGRGIAKSRDRCHSDNPDEAIRRFSVSALELASLKSAFQNAGLWTKYPEFWISEDPEEICLDGEEINFERRDVSGYGFSSANAQCTAPQVVLDAAKAFVRVAGEHRALRLLN